MATYNQNGNIKCIKTININDNGIEDFYDKESVIENGIESVTLENGNKKLSSVLTNPPKIPRISSITDYFRNFRFMFPEIMVENNILEEPQTDNDFNNNEN
jgi:hypothetical protein